MNTPSISASIIRKAAIYSGTRRSIERHEAPMQIGIRNTESMISINEMPSIPSAQLSVRPPSSNCSTNCHCEPPGTNFAHNRLPSARSTSVADNAIHRAVPALTNRQASAASSGTAIISERIGKSISASHRPGRRSDQPEHHHQRIAVEITRLEPGRDPVTDAHRIGCPVRTEAIDRLLVAALPEQPA